MRACQHRPQLAITIYNALHYAFRTNYLLPIVPVVENVIVERFESGARNFSGEIHVCVSDDGGPAGGEGDCFLVVSG